MEKERRKLYAGLEPPADVDWREDGRELRILAGRPIGVQLCKGLLGLLLSEVGILRGLAVGQELDLSEPFPLEAVGGVMFSGA